MSNQLLVPPEIEPDNSIEMPQPPLLNVLEAEDSSWRSLTENIRVLFFPRRQPALQLLSKPIHVPDPFHQKSIWAGIGEDFRALFFPRKLPPLLLESKAVAVRDPMAQPRDRMSSLLSIGIHAAVFAVILVLIFGHKKKPAMAAQVVESPVFNITPFVPSSKPAGGGGGGGDREVLHSPAGKLPKIAKVQIVPPDEIIRNPKPKLVAEPTVVMPAEIKMPNSAMPNLGVPTTTVHGPASNGPGSFGGIGSGTSGGVGSGSGAGVGPGSGGGFGGGVYQVGNGVRPPVPIFAPEPEFSDQARMAKYQGECIVEVVVDTKGMPRNPRVIRHLGMGLDQKALEAVEKYRFKPATLGGRPVAVRMDILIDFHIY